MNSSIATSHNTGQGSHSSLSQRTARADEKIAAIKAKLHAMVSQRSAMTHAGRSDAEYERFLSSLNSQITAADGEKKRILDSTSDCNDEPVDAAAYFDCEYDSDDKDSCLRPTETSGMTSTSDNLPAFRGCRDNFRTLDR
jgi:hypothetical protein